MPTSTGCGIHETPRHWPPGPRNADPTEAHSPEPPASCTTTSCAYSASPLPCRRPLSANCLPLAFAYWPSMETPGHIAPPDVAHHFSAPSRTTTSCAYSASSPPRAPPPLEVTLHIASSLPPNWSACFYIEHPFLYSTLTTRLRFIAPPSHKWPGPHQRAISDSGFAVSRRNTFCTGQLHVIHGIM